MGASQECFVWLHVGVSATGLNALVIVSHDVCSRACLMITSTQPPNCFFGSFLPSFSQALLRSILASHPIDILKADKKGVTVRLTKSEIKEVRCGTRQAKKLMFFIPPHFSSTCWLWCTHPHNRRSSAVTHKPSACWRSVVPWHR